MNFDSVLIYHREHDVVGGNQPKGVGNLHQCGVSILLTDNSLWMNMAEGISRWEQKHVNVFSPAGKSQREREMIILGKELPVAALS